MATLAMAALMLSGASVGNSPSAASLIVANKGDAAVGIIDPHSGQQVAEVPEGGVTTHEVIASPDGRLVYAPIYGNSGVGKPGTNGSNMVVIDIASRKVVGNLDFGHGVRPHCPQFGPKNGLLYVTTELDKTISIIDPKILKIVGTVPTGQAESHMLAISKDGRRGYTANVGPGTVSVLDLENRKVVAIVPISKETQRISLAADDSMAFTSDQKTPTLVVIDTASNKVKTRVPLPSAGYGTAATHDGKYLVVCMPGANQVAVVDLHAMKVARTIDVPAAPQEALIQPDGQMAYISCDKSGKIAAISTSDWKVAKLITAGKTADGLAWAK
jgi:YVTN family beta-propeller protein